MTELEIAKADKAVAGFPNRSFHALWTALSVSQLGSAVSAVMIPLIAAVTLGASPGQMGALAALTMVPSFLIKVPAAAWSDALRRSRVPLMIFCNLAQGATVLVVPLLWWLGGLTFTALVAVVCVGSLLQGIYSSLSSPVLVDVVPKQHLPAANGKLSATRSAADIGGPALGGALLAVLAAPVVVLIDGVSFLLSALLLTRVPRSADPSAGKPRTRIFADGGLRALTERLLRGSGLQAVITVAFVNGVTDAVLVLFLVRDLRMSPTLIGVLLSLGAVGGITGGLLVGRLMGRYGLGRTLVLGTVVTMASLAVLPFAAAGLSGAAGLVILELAGSLGGTLMVATIFGALQAGAPDGKVARVMALSSTFLQIATVVGAVLGGVVATYLGLRTTMALSAAILILALIPQLIRWRTRQWNID